MSTTHVAARLTRRAILLAALIAISGYALVLSPARSLSAQPGTSKPTIILVHGAWADATSWSGVITRLQAAGYRVIAPANPLRGLASDAAYLGSILDTIPGPVILVGHSYGGAVITNAAAGRTSVTALVYVAAFIPDKGDDLNTLVTSTPGSQLVPPGLPGATLVARPYPLPDAGMGVDTYIDPAAFGRIFAADVDAGTATVMAATQRPLAAGALAEKSGPAAWKTIPAWAIVATADNAIGTENVRAMARHAGARITEVDASHAVLVSHPEIVANLIAGAATATP